MRLRSVLISLVIATAGISGCENDDITLSEQQIARAVELAELVDGTIVQNHVEELAARREMEDVEFPPWGVNMPLARVSSGNYIIDELRGYGFEPVQEVMTANDMESLNIYVDVVGSERPDEIVLITAHYDAWHQGADDNASGVAVLLECARILAQSSPPHRTIRIVAFDREEEGIIGSRRYADQHQDDLVTVVINLDAVGYTDLTPGSQGQLPGVVMPDTGDFIAAIASSDSRVLASRLAVLSNSLPKPIHVVGLISPGDGAYPILGDLLRSDHAWFWQNRTPALFLTDTANFRNPHYHQASDLPETLDYDFLERVAALTLGAAGVFANDF